MPFKHSELRSENKDSNSDFIEQLHGISDFDNNEEEQAPDNSLFKKATALKQTSKTYQLPGDIGKFLGRLSETDNSITLTGEMGSGKSRFAFQLANAYASIGKRVGIFSLEMSLIA